MAAQLLRDPPEVRQYAVVLVTGSIADGVFAPTREEMAAALPGLLADRDTR